MIYVALCTSHHSTKQRNTTLAPRTQETPQPGDQSGEGRRRWFALQGWWVHFTALKSFSVPLCINCVWGAQGSKQFDNKPLYSPLITCHYIASQHAPRITHMWPFMHAIMCQVCARLYRREKEAPKNVSERLRTETTSTLSSLGSHAAAKPWHAAIQMGEKKKRDMFQKAIIAAKAIKTHCIIIDYYQSWGVTD